MRKNRETASNFILEDSFTGGTIYTTAFLVAVLWDGDPIIISKALGENINLLALFASGGLLFFTKRFLDGVLADE
ncbi:MAG: hypothetical protein ABJL73_11750 [Lentilitoribacter sp.]